VPAILSRFAPAPTGYLHLGHVVNAIYVWGVTGAAGGRILLRIEDHDGRRSRPEYERAVLDDIDWLGFVPDEPSTDALRAGPCAGRQRDRYAVYESALEGLRAAGLVYACECSRSEILSANPPSPGGPDGQQRAGPTEGESRYPGTCATKGLPERFDDGRNGPQEQRPSEQCGDLLVRDRDGYWTYQFAAAVDDYVQGVTLVIRGDDLLASTGRQIQLARLLGRREPPAFYHHPLVMKTPEQKLSKSDGDTGVKDLRARGWTAPQVIGHAAALAGLIDVERPLRADEIGELRLKPRRHEDTKKT
jgi:glutamyl-tRNA synthetase/glutamyl-Q tRNA(Asp) synthetase